MLAQIATPQTTNPAHGRVWFWPLIVTSSDELRVLPLGLALFVTKNKVVWDILFAGSIVVTLPIVLMFILFQRQILKAVALSGLK